MANMRKFSAMKDIGHLDQHYKRGVQKGHYSNPDIDQNRLHEDHINFAPTRYKKEASGELILDEKTGRPVEMKMTDYIKETIADLYLGRTLRKDAVRMVCWVVDAPKNMPEEKKPDFFQAAYDFMADRYGKKSGMGEDIVLSCYWHRSETTDHIHFAFMPIIDRDGEKSFCAKEVVGRSDLKTFHQELENYMVEKGLCNKGDILTGSTQRDANGRALSIRELKARKNVRTREEKIHDDTSSRWAGNTMERKSEHERRNSRWEQ